MPTFADKKQALSERLRMSAGEVRLQKNISHIFRDRYRPPSTRLDVRAFNDVLEVDSAAEAVNVEGMTRM